MSEDTLSQIKQFVNSASIEDLRGFALHLNKAPSDRLRKLALFINYKIKELG